MNSKISIVVPVYNVEKYLEQSINSIINQTYTNTEIVLVDDGSSEISGEICDKYAESDERFIVIHKKNGGLSDSRNIGTKVANGDFLTYIDSDDYISPHYVEHLYSLITKYNADVACCNNFRHKGDDGIFTDDETSPIVMTGEEACLKMVNGTLWIQLVMACSKLFRTENIKQIQFPVDRVHEDESVSFLFYYGKDKIIYSDAKYYCWRWVHGSTSNSEYTLKRRNDHFYALKQRSDFFESKNEKKLARYSNNRLLSVMMQDSAKRNGRSDREVKMCYNAKRFTGFLDWRIRILHIVFTISPKLFMRLKNKLL